MSDFRFKNGLAYGPVGNFQSRTDNLITPGDTTPDVSDGNLFYTNNTSGTSISHFDLSGANVVSEHQGKGITVVTLDGNTTFVNGNQLRLTGGGNVVSNPGAVYQFLYVNSAWYQSATASLNTLGGALAAPSQVTVAIESANVAAGGAITITPATRIVTLLTGASSSMTLQVMNGGFTGQMVTFNNLGSSVTLTTNSAGATDSFVVSTVGGVSAIITGTKSVTFIRSVQGTTAKWFETNGIA